MKVLSSLRSRVLHVKLFGEIDTRMNIELHQHLHNKHFYDVHLLAVSINSQGGSLIQAKNISDCLQYFSKRVGAPVYTFAQDQVLNSANLILASGNKCYASKFSILGDFGFVYNGFGYKDAIQNVKIDMVNTKQVKLDPHQEFKEEDAKWMKKVLDDREQELKKLVIEKRLEKFNKLKLSNEEVNENLLNQGAIQPDQALKYGLIDEINSLESILDSMYSEIKILDQQRTGNVENFWQQNKRGLLDLFG